MQRVIILAGIVALEGRKQNDMFTKDTPQIVTSNRILYTASPFARSSLFHLQKIGELTALAPHTSKRSGLSSYLFISVVNASGCLTYDGKEYAMKAGHCAFIDCRHPYSHKTDEDLWTLRWCHFYSSSLSLIYAKYVERGGRPVFKPADPDRFQECWESIFAIAESSDYIISAACSKRSKVSAQACIGNSGRASRQKKNSSEIKQEFINQP